MKPEFKDYIKEPDPRSEFANKVCKYFYHFNNKDLDKTLKNLKSVYQDFQNNVRNIYELIQSEIPLFYLYELQKNGKDGFDFESEEEYNSEVEKTKELCKKIYN